MVVGDMAVALSAVVAGDRLRVRPGEKVPVDGVVLLMGCDKTTPGLIMGALSMDIPAIFVPAGPMLR